MTVWASWNGATEVARWEVLGGDSPDALVPLASAPRRGFETALSALRPAALRGGARAGLGRGGARAPPAPSATGRGH